MTPGGQRRAAAHAESDVRDRLVRAASAITAERGASAATSRAITDRADENLAAITYYFGSKEALVSEALIRQARTLVQPVLDVLGGDGAPAEKLLAAVQMLTQLVHQRSDQLAAYLECLAQAARDDQVAAEVRSLSRELQRHLADEMARLRDGGLIPAWVDPTAMASLIVALANGVVAGVVVDPDGTGPAAIGQQFASLLLTAQTTDTRP